MSLVLNRNFAGTAGASYANGDDADFDNVAGTAPTYQATANTGVTAVRFPAATQSIIGETIAGTPTVRTMSRIYKLSGAVTTLQEVLQARTTSGAHGPSVTFTSTNRLRLISTAGTSLATGTVAIPTGTEFRVTFVVNGTALSATMFADTSTTTPLETISGTNGSTTSFTSVRDGWTAAGGGGTGVTLDMSWPQDESTTTDPGPRTYGVPVTALFTGSGSLTADAVPRTTDTAAFTGSGALTADASPKVAVTAGFTGSGSLTAATSAVTAVTAPFTGSGALTAAVVPTASVTAPLTGSGSLTAATVPTAAVGAGFTGSGSLSAAFEFKAIIAAGFTGTGTLTASTATATSASVGAPFSGSGTLTAAVSSITAVTVSFTGSGSLTAEAVSAKAVTASFTGSGDLTAATQPATSVTVTFTSEGVLTADVASLVADVAMFTGDGELTAATAPLVSVSATFTGEGTLTATTATGTLPLFDTPRRPRATLAANRAGATIAAHHPEATLTWG